jgi:hypothetical protein
MENNQSYGSNAIFEVEHKEQNVYIVHIYVNVSTSEGRHTATNGWWAVNKITGEIRHVLASGEPAE